MSKLDYRKEFSIFRFTLIFYHVLTNLEFTLKLIRTFIIRECAFFGNEVENHLVVTVVTYITANQLGVPYYAWYVWSTLKEEIPLAPYLIHFFPVKRSTNTPLVKDINHVFEQEVKDSLLFIR